MKPKSQSKAIHDMTLFRIANIVGSLVLVLILVTLWWPHKPTMKTKSQSQEIHDMIQKFNLGAYPELMASRLLDIMEKMNQRMDDIEASSDRANHVASCLANGIQPD